MSHVPSRMLTRLLQSLRHTIVAGEVGELPDRDLLGRFAHRAGRGGLRHAVATSRAVGSAFVAACCETATTRTTRSRPPSSCWLARPARSASPIGWRTGSTAWPCASREDPNHAGARRVTQQQVADLPVRNRATGRSGTTRDRSLTTSCSACRRSSACRSCSATWRAGRGEEAARQLGWSEGAVKGMLEPAASGSVLG